MGTGDEVGVGLRLAVCVDRKKAEARRGEEPKDVGREEGGPGDPLVGGGGSTRAHSLLTQLGLVVRWAMKVAIAAFAVAVARESTAAFDVVVPL